MDSTSVIVQLNSLYKHFFTSERPAQWYHPQGNSLTNILIQNMHNRHFRGTLINKNEVDPEWYNFLYWVYIEDEARINDALHGHLWISDPQSFGICKPLNPKGSLAKVINMLPIVHIERAKEKNFAELIKGVGIKFDTKPSVMAIGYENLPFRNYGLRGANITMLYDPMQTKMLPERQLFPNPDQDIAYQTAERSHAKYACKGSHRELFRTQHVYIVDQHNMNVDTTFMVWEMINAARNLVDHGYFVYDIPLYSFRMIDKIRPIMRPILSEDYRDNHLLTLYGKADTTVVDTINLVGEANTYLADHGEKRYYLIDNIELVRNDAFKQPVAIRVRLEIRSY